MSDLYSNARDLIEKEDFPAFEFLKITDHLLSNPVSLPLGRDLVIRALDSQGSFSAYVAILRNLVRKAGLYPYLKNEFENVTPGEQAALDLYQTPASSEMVFHSMQYSVFDLLRKGRNVILSAPTSMGKSAIIDSLIGLGRYRKIVLVVPTIALADETRRRLSAKFSDRYKIIYHSSQEASSEHVIYILTQERVNEREDLNAIDLFVIDEFYKLAFRKKRDGNPDFDDERVVALNIALSKLLQVSKQFYMTGPFINNVSGLANLGVEYTLITSDFNTVAVDVHTFDLSPNDYDGKYKALEGIVKESSDPTIIYCKSAGVAGAVSRKIIELGHGKITKNEYVTWVEQNYDAEWDYALALRHGIGLHFGGLPRAFQQYTIDMFNQGKIQYLICTSTIIEGVNTIAKNVIIFDNRNGSRSIDKFTHGNIKGRAGRMGVHFVGKVYCLESLPNDDLNSEVDVPLGLQDESVPLNLLAGLQPEHLTEFSQGRFDLNETVARFGRDLLKKHTSFRIDQFETAYSFVEMLSDIRFKETLFQWSPSNEFLKILAELLLSVNSGAVRSAGMPQSANVIHARLVSYVSTPAYETYLEDQIIRAKERAREINDSKTISSYINDDLKVVYNLFGYTVPKLLALLEDIVGVESMIRGFNEKIDYSRVRGIFENYHLPASLAGLEEMGVPIQTLQRISAQNDLPEHPSVDEMAMFIRSNSFLWKNLNEMDRAFLSRALER